MGHWKTVAIAAGAVLFVVVAALGGMAAAALGPGHPLVVLLVVTPAPILYGLLFVKTWHRALFALSVLYLTASLILVVAVWGVGWAASERLRDGGLGREVTARIYDLEVVSVSSGSVVLMKTDLTEDNSPWLADGLWGLESQSGGYNRVGAILKQDGLQVERELVPVSVGGLDTGEMVRMDSWAYEGNPQTGLDIPYQDVTYESPLGTFPAWLVGNGSRTWAVFVHGKGSGLGQGLRVLRTLADLSMPTLFITYRNDDGVPTSPDGFYRYGATEWEDLEGAVQYALDHGAQEVVLIGYSMGGAIIMGFLEHSPLAANVAGVVLDAPMLSFASTVDFGGREEGHPRLAVVVGKAVSRYRFEVDWGAVDYLQRADNLSVPVLLIHGDADKRVPIETSETLAQARPDLVIYMRFPGAPHVAAWNFDPASYERVLRDFLAGLAK
ncbi:MAG: hypothetical protein FJ312_02035 [SAR202 cluster bacterium]|nr:hypothetical protein [SAR202 cluster bacterium]